ncbi:MAG TPA: hypothetical protein VLZ09_01170 [Gaiellaceae bacterium]|nr:hypothetical protein [Gaiellaceae bacterium]
MAKKNVHRYEVKVSRAALQKRIDKKTAELAKLTLRLAGLPPVEVAIVADPQAP